MRINVRAFAMTTGLVWGVGIFALTWWVMAFDGQGTDPGLLGHLYRGYSITPGGGFIGLAWGLADGFVGGLIAAWLYNLLAGRD